MNWAGFIVSDVIDNNGCRFIIAKNMRLRLFAAIASLAAFTACPAEALNLPSRTVTNDNTFAQIEVMKKDKDPNNEKALKKVMKKEEQKKEIELRATKPKETQSFEKALDDQKKKDKFLPHEMKTLNK